MKRGGFTLIELSIVLVIIGLIVGGVLVGQDLVQAAKLRSLMTQKESYDTAVNTFKLKYNCLPGDCDNAVAFGLGTDGDGDRLIDNPDIDWGTGDSRLEIYYLWQHLSNAGLVSGDFTGTAVAGCGPNFCTIPGTNVPKGSIDGSHVNISYMMAITFPDDLPRDGHVFALSRLEGSLRGERGILTPIQQYSIDAKVDDGMPFQGNLVDRRGAMFDFQTPDCTTSEDISTAEYDISSTQQDCRIIWYSAF